MPSLLQIIMAVILIAQFAWLTILTLSLRSFRNQTHHSRHRTSQPVKLDKAADRLPDTVASLELKFIKIIDRLKRLEAEVEADRHERNSQSDVYSEAMPELKSMLSAHPSQLDEPLSETAENSGDESLRRSIKLAFNRLAQDFQPSLLRDFLDSYEPKSFAIRSGEFIENSEGPFWIIDIPHSQSSCLILPSSKVAKDWDKFYRSMQGLKAQSDLSDVFEISEAGHLSLLDPAIGSRSGNYISLVEKGKLAGI